MVMLKHWIAANMVEGIGPARLKKLMDEHGSIEKVCAAIDAPVLKAEEEIRSAETKNIRIFSVEDNGYPFLLKQIHDPPPVIYVKGDLLEKDKNAIAIVGTRIASRYGLNTAKQFAFELASLGITVISGMALGIDAAAHEGALDAGGRTIAVLGCGVDRIYPPENSELYSKIIEKGGAIVSEYPIGFPHDKWTFPQRNRIISGLSLGVIIIEGGYKSGAMITAKVALEQGREVFAVPQNIDSELGRGPHWLIKQGAKLVESVDDVLDELKFQIPNLKTCPERIEGSQTNPKSQLQKTRPENLSTEEEKIYNVLSATPKHFDQITISCGLSVQQVASLLTMLEIKKIVHQLPGKLFILQ
ncbi:MAG: DNA-processing protein DprA [Candidatus Margulisiibacteriota bacterium]